MPDFEEEYTSAIYLNKEDGLIDHFLNPMDASIGGPKYISVRKLMDDYKGTKSIFESPAGTRVSLRGEPADLILTYGDKLPDLNSKGTIVTVKTANGNSTSHNGQLFVKWDTGEFGGYLPEHLNLTDDTVSNIHRKAYSSIDLSDFMKVSNSENELVHKASRDLWSFKVVEGEAIIERLFNELDGKPLKC